MKKCSCCKIVQSLTNFSKQKHSKSGIRSYCRTCAKQKYRAYATKSGRYKGIIRPIGKQFVCHKPKLTITAYNQMLENQGNVCEICGEKQRVRCSRTGQPLRLFIDHCHTTGKIRGLLCSQCNTALGMLDDDLDLLASATSYLINSS